MKNLETKTLYFNFFASDDRYKFINTAKVLANTAIIDNQIINNWNPKTKLVCNTDSILVTNAIGDHFNINRLLSLSILKILSYKISKAYLDLNDFIYQTPSNYKHIFGENNVNDSLFSKNLVVYTYNIGDVKVGSYVMCIAENSNIEVKYNVNFRECFSSAYNYVSYIAEQKKNLNN